MKAANSCTDSVQRQNVHEGMRTLPKERSRSGMLTASRFVACSTATRLPANCPPAASLGTAGSAALLSLSPAGLPDSSRSRAMSDACICRSRAAASSATAAALHPLKYQSNTSEQRQQYRCDGSASRRQHILRLNRTWLTVRLDCGIMLGGSRTAAVLSVPGPVAQCLVN